MDKFFSPEEFYKPRSRSLKLPPKDVWENILPVLDSLLGLRVRWNAPLIIKAAYRPEGGAPRSQHKSNRALDVDCDLREGNIVDWRKLTVELYRQHSLSIGHYMNNPQRVHIDCRARQSSWLKGRDGRSLRPTFCQKGRRWDSV